LKPYISKELGQISFYLGVFFLSSALPISLIFFLVSTSISFKINKFEILKEKSSYFFLICSLLMILSSINSSFNLKEITEVNALQIFASLFNWIPQFILFLTSQIYLKTSKQRETIIKFLIAGTFPVILSCLLQLVFKIHGPFETLNGLIIWFQKPITGGRGVSGLFSNQNYAGVWLTTLLPFTLFELSNTKKISLEKFSLIITNLLILFFAVRTNSRNALLGLSICSIMLIRFRILLIFITSLISSFLLNINKLVFNIFQDSNLINILIPASLTRQFSVFNFNNFYEYPRIKIYSITLDLISSNPFLGWGASTFSNLYRLKSNNGSHQHSHNIFLELAFNFGIPLAIFMLVILIKFLVDSFRLIYKKNHNNKLYSEKAWLVSSFIIIFCQLNDITYFDGKIGLLIWILLTGLKCILNENEKVLYNS
jgi:O-antigen ligase